MLSENLNAALPKGYAEEGYSLEEPDTHILELKFKGEVIAWWQATKANCAEIERECRGHAHREGV